ncbi:MAG TPA: Fic family protein [Chthoniobacteraceae bacterium]|nr:Fic family protein [Chthoniobacteraceae bacterium]
MHFRADTPFNDLPDLPPQTELETPRVLKATTRASRALAELKGRTHTIPNPTILLNTLALQEAKLSSEIENIFTTNDELYRGLTADGDGGDVSPHAKEVLHYRDALWRGMNVIQERPFLSTNLAIEIVNIIKKNRAGIRNLPGTKLQNPSAKQVVYTPPEGQDLIRRKLANLERFSNDPSSELDPLVRVGVAHYQFEAIHPFFDGNGRTGRILIILQLIMNELLEIPILFLSRFIIEHKTQYYRSLRAVTERGEWEGWLLYMLEAIESTARGTTEKINAIHSLLAETLDRAKQLLPKAVFSKELIELIFEQPYCKIRFVENAGIAKRLTATKYLRELEKHSFVLGTKRGTELIFINRRLWQLLTDEPLAKTGPRTKT